MHFLCYLLGLDTLQILNLMFFHLNPSGLKNTIKGKFNYHRGSIYIPCWSDLSFRRGICPHDMSEETRPLPWQYYWTRPVRSEMCRDPSPNRSILIRSKGGILDPSWGSWRENWIDCLVWWGTEENPLGQRCPSSQSRQDVFIGLLWPKREWLI